MLLTNCFRLSTFDFRLIAFDFLQTIVQVFSEEQENSYNGNGDTWVCEVKHRSEEDTFSGCVTDKRKIEHIDYFAVEPARIAEEFAVEDAIDDISQSAGCN